MPIVLPPEGAPACDVPDIVIEDGSIVDGANSYATTDELKAFACMQGAELADADSDLRIALFKAAAYLESVGHKFQGCKTSPESQELQWPRSGVRIDCLQVGQNDIPRELKQAQMQLAIEAQSNDLMPNRLPNDKGQVQSVEVVGAVKTAYTNHGTPNQVPAFAKADALLAVLYKRNGLFLHRS